MKWFLGLKQGNNDSPDYVKMLKVAVRSARQHTSLEPYLLYDGEPDDLTRWLENEGVTLLFVRSFLHDALAKIAEEKNDVNHLVAGGGTFLRMEIPRLTQELGFPDEFALYTDCDVLFRSEVVPELSALRPRYFAVAPEQTLGDYKNMNAGVMLMNLPALRQVDDELRAYLLKKIRWLNEKSRDQTAYQKFFRRGLFRKPMWEVLPPEFNWKPYWNDVQRARILHFHGPKPHQREVMLSGNLPWYWQNMKPLITEGYAECCEIWDREWEVIARE